jgi:hypothetical protein
MELENSSSVFMMLMYVYLRSYEEAIQDFETAIKDVGYPDMALTALRQKYGERIDKVAKEMCAS